MYTNDELKNLSDDERKRKRNSLQMEIIMLESEAGKLTTEKNTLETEIRKMKMDEERLRIMMDEKRKRFDNVSRNIEEKEAEVKSARKKMNLL